MEALQYHLMGRHFILITKHTPLQWLARHKNSKFVHWLLLLQDFSFQVLHQAVALHVNADALSLTWSLHSQLRARHGETCDSSVLCSLKASAPHLATLALLAKAATHLQFAMLRQAKFTNFL